MKRSALLKHLKKNGCILLREGSGHSLYINPINGRMASIGRHTELANLRHTELANLMCKIICKQLEIESV
jgi:mRNA interferase HicA